MTIPKLKEFPVDTWTLVEEGVTSITAWKEPKETCNVRYTYRPSGDPSPISPREGIPVFQEDSEQSKTIDSIYPVDIYFYASGESGTLWYASDFGPSHGVRSIVPGSNVQTNVTVELTKSEMMFGGQDVFEDIAVGSTVDFLIDSTASDADYVVVYDFEFKTSQGKIIQRGYVGGDYVAGTSVPIYNRNGQSLVTPKTVLTKDPTVNTLGTNVNAFLGGSETQGLFLGGGTISGNFANFPVVVNKSGPSLLRFVQTGGTGTFDLEFKMIFAEVYK